MNLRQQLYGKPMLAFHEFQLATGATRARHATSENARQSRGNLPPYRELSYSMYDTATEEVTMGVRTVRLDPETEQILAEIVQTTGLSISEALTQGLLALHTQLTTQLQRTPYDIYAALDLGPGGTAIAPSTETRRGVRAALQQKHGR
jgi:hypothetical protein